MWCPDGHGEFQPQMDWCLDCGAALVDAEPSVESDPLVSRAPEPTRQPFSTLPGVGPEVERDAVSLSLRSAGIAFVWSANDLAVASDRTDEALELVALIDPTDGASTRPRDLVARATTPSPRIRALLVWGPAIASFAYGAAALDAKRWAADETDTGYWQAIAVVALASAAIATAAVAANWESRFHRRAIWLIVPAVAAVIVAALR